MQNNNIDTFSSLTKHHKEAIGLLSVGTFLEYFDLMIYVHMAVLLNELFFPKTDPNTTALISAGTFCTTFVFRPLGALIFGWIGDNVGRKATVVITTAMMAISCAIMANLPTYAQIGIAASWAITICRIIQGLTSMGEIIGAEIYLTELIRPPARYPIVYFMQCAATVGGMTALAMATIIFSLRLEWRIVFWIGAMIALVGSVARTVLRETPEFADAKRRIKIKYNKLHVDQKTLKEDVFFKTKVNPKTALACFLIQCGSPICFYFRYIYCGDLLKNQFHFTAEQVIKQNLIVSIINILAILCITYLCYRINPLKIIKCIMIVFSFFILFIPFLLPHLTCPFEIFIIQIFLNFFAIDGSIANPVLFVHFPIFKRFTYTSFIYALSRALTYIIGSFGLVYLIKQFESWGLLIIFIPITLGFNFGISHFEKLEKAAENHRLNSFPN